jgi:ribA/ribD-fused uncharacterized protein
MMAEKARLFGDQAAAALILAAGGPAAAKTIGRQVRGFSDERWAAARFDIVVRGNVAKFGADQSLRAYLLSTGDDVLVEASPTDRVWGIGVRDQDDRARQPDRWPGLNLLGFALVEARRQLRGG